MNNHFRKANILQIIEHQCVRLEIDNFRCQATFRMKTGALN